jgi:hypothetical protein
VRRFVLFGPFALAASVVASAAGGVPGPSRPLDPGVYGGGYFAVACGFSHRNQDDPIVHPRHRGRSHDHTYFGNTSTSAASTPASLRSAGQTTCNLAADTAAYWAPTLFRDGRAVEPLGAVVVYARRTFDAVDPFPAGLKVIAGNAAARTAQSRRVTYWSCGDKSGERSATVPTCPAGKLTHARRSGRPVPERVRLPTEAPLARWRAPEVAGDPGARLDEPDAAVDGQAELG